MRARLRPTRRDCVCVRLRRCGRHSVLGPRRAAFALPKISLANVCGFGDAEVGGVEHRDGVGCKAIGERRDESHAPFLLIEIFNVAARLRSENDAAMTPLRRTDRTLARAAGAFLTPRFASTAGDFVALERGRRAGARICHLAMHRAIDDGELIARHRRAVRSAFRRRPAPRRMPSMTCGIRLCPCAS